jgi:photosystem II stability/assembly factor-like uncharacterized protein
MRALPRGLILTLILFPALVDSSNASLEPSSLDSSRLETSKLDPSSQFRSAVDNVEFPSAVNGNEVIYLPIITHSYETLPIGPDGGHIVALAIDPTNASIEYAGTWGAGIYKTTDAGQGWVLMNNGLGNLYINFIAIDPVTPSTIYLGTQKDGVYKSTNAGSSWSATGPGLNSEAIVYTIAIDPSAPDTVYAGTRSPGSTPPWGGGVYKSTNGGGTWQAMNSGLGEEWVYSIAIHPTTPSILYAATHSAGVYKSSNGGSSWTEANNGIDDLATRALVINPNFTHTVYVGTWHGDSIYKTTDDGANWSQMNTGLNGAKIFSLILDPAVPQTLYAATYHTGVFKTTNGGTSWSSAGLGADFVYRIAKHDGLNAPLIAGTAGDGLYQSIDSASSWSSSDAGLKASSVTSWLIDPVSPSTVYTSVYGGGVFKSTNNGETWVEANSGLEDKFVHALAMTSSTVLLAGTDRSGVYISIDGGATWTASNSGMPAALIPFGALGPPFNHFEDAEWFDPGMLFDFDKESANLQGFSFGGTNVSVLSISIDPDTPATIYLGTNGNGILKSTNGGASWNATGSTTEIVHAVAINPFNTATIFGGVDGGQGSMVMSSDGGSNWIYANNGLGGATVNAVIFDPNTLNRMYAATNSGIFLSTDGGTSWGASGLSGLRVYSITFNPSDPSQLYAGAEDGLYLSVDSGASWVQVSEGLVDPHVQSISLDVDNGFIYYGTMGSGGYRRNRLLP